MGETLTGKVQVWISNKEIGFANFGGTEVFFQLQGHCETGGTGQDPVLFPRNHCPGKEPQQGDRIVAQVMQGSKGFFALNWGYVPLDHMQELADLDHLASCVGYPVVFDNAKSGKKTSGTLENVVLDVPNHTMTVEYWPNQTDITETQTYPIGSANWDVDGYYRIVVTIPNHVEIRFNYPTLPEEE